MPRSIRFLLLGSVLGAVLIAGILAAATRRSSASAPDKTTSAIASATTPPVTSTDAIVAPPGTVLHVAKKGETMATLVRLYFADSSYMTISDFESAVRERNGDFKGAFLKPGANLIIPGMDNPIHSENAVLVPKDFEVKAVYLTGLMAGSDKGINIVREWKKAGGNSVVFDIKDSDGSLSIASDNPLAPQGRKPYIRNLPKYTHWLHSQNLHAIARIAIFRDELLVTHHPELAVKSRATGQPWRENGKLVWTDPSNPAVQDYNISLAKAAIAGGVDEVQFDYVRFPAEGDQKDASFHFEKTHPDWKRSDVITNFLSRAYEQIHPSGVLLSLDVFGVMAWQRPVDLSHTGQDIVGMAKYCDVLSPMIYPSHFFGMDGYANPGDAPEHFIAESMDRFLKITAGSGVVIRPWLQAFAWRTKTYSPDYIRVQVATAHEHGGDGFLFWNARNDYGKPYVAMPEMAAKPAAYFHVESAAGKSDNSAQPGATVKPAVEKSAPETSTGPAGTN
ncbi:MAG TPA: putative glycoside hydrolase [Terriglobales bacterium]|nr:putative glycoside hydrolase [Terriglobales bacterium]